MSWSGRWYKFGAVLHAEQVAYPVTVCGKKIKRDAKPVALDSSLDVCEGCWQGASR